MDRLRRDAATEKNETEVASDSEALRRRIAAASPRLRQETAGTKTSDGAVYRTSQTPSRAPPLADRWFTMLPRRSQPKPSLARPALSAIASGCRTDAGIHCGVSGEEPIGALNFDNTFVRELPADPSLENRRRQVLGACFSHVEPTAVPRPQLLSWSAEVAELLGLSAEDMQSERLVAVLGGNATLSGMQPYAACYGGHQFGNWAGQLGDGRAITLGETVNRHGDRWELQLKGAGPTPYSRSADGRAVLRSSVREFLCSEAMHHLGVPTTRALSLVSTGERVARDMFYDGNVELEPGAIVCRVAPTFLRFGSFEILAAQRDVATLKRLVDYTIRVHFAELGEPSEATYLAWLSEICRRTARLVVEWTRVGFVHGVMNTDNMSILGLTIDYGPYGWLEGYDPRWTPNTTDAHGRRYCFGNQAQIALWNLVRLAEALASLFADPGQLEHRLSTFGDAFGGFQREMMARKLGLDQLRSADVEDGGGFGDRGLVQELYAIMQLTETDVTIFFRALANLPIAEGVEDDRLLAPIRDAYYAPNQLSPAQVGRITAWLRSYAKRVRHEGTSNRRRKQRMDAANPKYVLRNYLAQQAIDRARDGDPSMIHELLNVLRHPYDEQPDKSHFAQKRPEWARNRPGCSMLSCSS